MLYPWSGAWLSGADPGILDRGRGFFFRGMVSGGDALVGAQEAKPPDAPQF